MVNNFPNDRINNFNEAIFAIAITLLVLEVKVPPLADIDRLGTLGVLNSLATSFIGLLISFFVTAVYWRAHLVLAQFISKYNSRLFWLNVWLLLFVVLLPFSTAFYSKGFNYNGPFIFYSLNLFFIGLFYFLMTRAVIQKEGYSQNLTPLVAKWLTFRASVAPLVWLVSIAIATPFPVIARFFFASIFLVLAIGERRFKKKAKAEELLQKMKDQELAAAENDVADEAPTSKESLQ